MVINIGYDIIYNDICRVCKAMFPDMVGLLHLSHLNANMFDTRVTRDASIMEIFPDGASLRMGHFVGFSEGSSYDATVLYLTY